MIQEVDHDPFQIPFRHLAVADHEGNLRKHTFQKMYDRVDRLDSVMHKVHLAPTIYFSQNRLSYDFIIKSDDFCMHGQSVFGWRVYDGHIPGIDQ